MTGNVDDVIHPAHDPEVAVFVFTGTVAGEIHAGNLRPVLLHIAIGIAVNRAQHSRPGLLKHQKSARASGDGFAIHGDDLGHHTRKRFGSRTRLGSNRAGNRRDHDVAGFGLPPGIDDRATVVADHLAVPHPGLRVDRLTYCTEQTKAVEFVLFGPLVSPTQESSDGSGRGVKDAYFMAIDDAPESIRLGKVGRAFVHYGSGAVLQRAVDDVAVAGYPSDIGGTPIDVFLVKIENPFSGDVGPDRISAGGVHYALGLSRGARGVEDIKRMLGVE